MRYFLCVHSFAPIISLIGDTGWLPSLYWVVILRYWNRLLSFDTNRLTRRVFEYDYRICSNNWCSEAKKIMTTLDLSSNFNYKLPVNIIEVEIKINSHYASIWSEMVKKTDKLRTYNFFKDTHNTEKYIQINLAKNERSVLAQLRCGILPLRVETGRYVGESMRTDCVNCVFWVK